MIELTHLTGKVFWLNPHEIEYIESNPDTTIGLLSGNHIIVREACAEVVERVIAYRKSLGVFHNEE